LQKRLVVFDQAKDLDPLLQVEYHNLEVMI